MPQVAVTQTAAPSWLPPTDEPPPLEEGERSYIRHVLDAGGGNKRQAARLLGIARRTLYRKLDEMEDSPRPSQVRTSPGAGNGRILLANSKQALREPVS